MLIRLDGIPGRFFSMQDNDGEVAAAEEVNCKPHQR